jgi:hypothetical protein
MRPPLPSSARRAHPALTSTHALLTPDGFDSSHDHNSLVLASRRRFRAASAWDTAPHGGGRYSDVTPSAVRDAKTHSRATEALRRGVGEFRAPLAGLSVITSYQ